MTDEGTSRPSFQVVYNFVHHIFQCKQTGGTLFNALAILAASLRGRMAHVFYCFLLRADPSGSIYS